MKATRKTILIFCLAVIAISFSHGTACGQGSIEILNVFTTDFAGNPTIFFHPGDNVRYHVEFEISGVQDDKAIAKGSALGTKIKSGGLEGVFKTKLEKQKARLSDGTHRFSWDERLPQGALAGNVDYTIKVRLKQSDTEDAKVGFLSVEEAPSQIAFVRHAIVVPGEDAIENKDIWIMNPDGSDQRQLTFEPADDRGPSISPNGMQIAFASNRSGNFDIWLLDLEVQAGLTQLTDHPADDLQPVWSPDGKRIAFTSKRGGSRDIWTLDVYNGNLEQLTRSNFIEKGAAWAKNGRRILYVSDRDGNDDIFRMKANGRKREQLIFEIGDQRAPDWSDTTREMVFAWWEFSKSKANLYAMDFNGENLRQLTSKGFYDRGPNWSPNGARIAFASNRGGNFDIWSMKSDGSDMVQLIIDSRKETAPDWKKAGFSDEIMMQSQIDAKGRRNIVFIGALHLAQGGALTVEMSWTDAADLDLGILEPDGNLITWKNAEGFGRHQGNEIPGPGTEVYTLSGATRGEYLIGAYYKNFASIAGWRIRWRDGSFEEFMN